MKNKYTRFLSGYKIVIGLLIITVISYFIYSIQMAWSDGKLKGSVRFSPPISLSFFTLEDYQHHVFNKDNLKGSWSFIYFAHITKNNERESKKIISALQEVRNKLSYPTDADLPKIIIITGDDQSHNELLNNYLKAYKTHIVELTGSKKEIKHLKHELHFALEHSKNKAKLAKDFKKEQLVLLLNPSMELAGAIIKPTQPSIIAHDFSIFKDTVR